MDRIFFIHWSSEGHLHFFLNVDLLELEIKQVLLLKNYMHKISVTYAGPPQGSHCLAQRSFSSREIESCKSSGVVRGTQAPGKPLPSLSIVPSSTKGR